MTLGMVYLQEPKALDQIVYHSRNVNRPGCVDLFFPCFYARCL